MGTELSPNISFILWHSLLHLITSRFISMILLQHVCVVLYSESVKAVPVLHCCCGTVFFVYRGLPKYLLTTSNRAKRGRGLTWRQSMKEISSGWGDMSFPGLLDWSLKDNKGASQTLPVDVQLLSCWLRTTPKAHLRLGSQEPGNLLRHIKWEMDWLISQCQLVTYI